MNGATSIMLASGSWKNICVILMPPSTTCSLMYSTPRLFSRSSTSDSESDYAPDIAGATISCSNTMAVPLDEATSGTAIASVPHI